MTVNKIFPDRSVLVDIENRYGPAKECHRLSGGINARVYRLTCDRELVVKFYRDIKRGLNECMFLESAKDHSIDCIPEVLINKTRFGWALLSDLGGKAIDSTDWSVLEYALAFQEALRDSGLQESYPKEIKAKEACNTLREHHKMLGLRLDSLDCNESLDCFPRTKRLVICKTSEYLTRAREKASSLTLLDKEMSPWISQSDVGTHNMLRDTKSDIYGFVDFEYAGWDDPAKFFVDWCIRPEAVLHPSVCQEFLLAAYRRGLIKLSTIRRVCQLMDVYMFKWTIIRLNYLSSVAKDGQTLADEVIEKDILAYWEEVGAVSRCIQDC